MCGNKTLSSLQKCEQNLISFSFEANTIEVTNDRAIMIFNSRLLSVCGNTSFQNRNEMKQVHEIFQYKFDQETPRKQKFLKWEHKLSATGIIKYEQRSRIPSKIPGSPNS